LEEQERQSFALLDMVNVSYVSQFEVVGKQEKFKLFKAKSLSQAEHWIDDTVLSIWVQFIGRRPHFLEESYNL
jgi:hypothetical protein